jgi:NAD(P)-dependent dehydrogenase (short-subunit alcohol dehydrogenase family)
MSKKIILITGASSGFGRLMAEALAKAGNTVYASMRDIAGRNAKNATEMAETSKRDGVDLRAIELDVQSEPSIDEAVKEIMAESGKIDVLVHNAGHMMFGPAEAFLPEQFAVQYDVNVLGTQRVNGPSCRTCARRNKVCFSGSRVAAPLAERRPISRPISRPKRRWTRWPSSMRASCRAGASRRLRSIGAILAL